MGVLLGGIRVQGWIGNLCLVVERELFGQAPLNELHGHTVGKQLTNEIARLEEVLMPLLERCHRIMVRSIAHLDARRGKFATTSVTVGQAAQVNVDCAVMNKVGRHLEQGTSDSSERVSLARRITGSSAAVT